MSRRHADIWSHPGHYLVDHYTWPWSSNGQYHIWPWKFKYQCHGQGQTHYHIWGLEFKSICLLFASWQSDHFWLRYSKFHIWPWKFKVKVMAKVKSDGHIWRLEFNWCVCFSFRGNQTIFGRYSQFRCRANYISRNFIQTLFLANYIVIRACRFADAMQLTFLRYGYPQHRCVLAAFQKRLLITVYIWLLNCHSFCHIYIYIWI